VEHVVRLTFYYGRMLRRRRTRVHKRSGVPMIAVVVVTVTLRQASVSVKFGVLVRHARKQFVRHMMICA